VPTSKCPLDLWGYQEILYQVRPEFVVECGTHLGGSALFLAPLCQLPGHVLPIDLAVARRPPLTRPVHVGVPGCQARSHSSATKSMSGPIATRAN
jgi:cephalosporin hydroxylase